MQLYGSNWKRRVLATRVGRFDQLFGVQRLMGAEGPEAGNEFIQVRTGAGLSYTVTPMRGLDIHQAEIGGASIAWMSPNGNPHPAFYESKGEDWLYTGAGGLLMTCGLTQVGVPVEVDGESLGLHGRAHHTPARQVAAEINWQGNEGEIRVAGVLEERRIFGHQLRLQREIKSRLGTNCIELHDIVENCGFEPAPLMILYHFNFGFPFLSEDSRLEFPPGKIIPREKETPIEDLDRWHAPAHGYSERVYYHEELDAQDGWTKVILRNPRFPMPGGVDQAMVAVELSWQVENLPRFVQWRMPGEGMHVLGIEPANCHVEGRQAEQEKYNLVTLQPGEVRDYRLKLDIKVNRLEV